MARRTLVPAIGQLRRLKVVMNTRDLMMPPPSLHRGVRALIRKNMHLLALVNPLKMSSWFVMPLPLTQHPFLPVI